MNRNKYSIASANNYNNKLSLMSIYTKLLTTTCSVLSNCILSCREADPAPFCDEDDYMSGKLSCTDDHKVIARCNMRNFTYLPKEYQVSEEVCMLSVLILLVQYFSSGDYIYPGGSLPRADYCPFNQVYHSYIMCT